MAWHGLTMPDVASAIGSTVSTVERRLSRTAKTRKSFLGFELLMLADYFGVPVSVFYTGEVDVKSSRLGVAGGATTGRWSPLAYGVSPRVLVGSAA